MRKAYRWLSYLLAIEVIVQAMVIAYAFAGLGKWVDDGHTLTKKVWSSDSPDFTGSGGLAFHGINGLMVMPLLAIVLLIVSLFAKVDGGTRRAAVLLGVVVLQVVLGLALHGVPLIAPLHALLAFGILAMAGMAGQRAADEVPAEAPS
ncbi:MAG: hypothetical protein JWM22_79 [Frankiales bacterium]|jgi:hypothetical protein|nr:hypothetical protein [Frankiales bacterium]